MNTVNTGQVDFDVAERQAVQDWWKAAEVVPTALRAVDVITPSDATPYVLNHWGDAVNGFVPSVFFGLQTHEVRTGPDGNTHPTTHSVWKSALMRTELLFWAVTQGHIKKAAPGRIVDMVQEAAGDAAERGASVFTYSHGVDLHEGASTFTTMVWDDGLPRILDTVPEGIRYHAYGLRYDTNFFLSSVGRNALRNFGGTVTLASGDAAIDLSIAEDGVQDQGRRIDAIAGNALVIRLPWRDKTNWRAAREG